MSAGETLVDLLLDRAEEGGSLGYHYLRDGETDVEDLTYSELARDAATIAGELASEVPPGGRAVLVYPPGLDFIRAFFGTLMAGVIAVPVAPPTGDLAAWAAGLGRIVADAQPSVVLTTELFRGFIEDADLDLASDDLLWLASDEWSGLSSRPPARQVRSTDVAFLQYTSGSTSFPKGVVLRHENLLANLRAIQDGFHFTRDSRMASWLPMFHDMGLIGAVFEPLHTGLDAYFMSPLDFLQKPARWLEMITRFEITHSGAPNFGYELCVRKGDPGAALDLSSWEVAFNGAEVVRAATIEQFCELYEPAGFARSAFLPCYGLAEASLLVSGVHHASEPTIVSGERETRLVSVGQAPISVETVIVGDDREPLPEGEIGEVWVGGPSVGAGYWRNPDASSAAFGALLRDGSGPFLRTGDLGFVRDGELFITGRIKEVLLIRGRNIFPHDIEDAAQRGDSRLRPGCGVAFAIDTSDGELPVVVQEVRDEADDLDAIVAGIRSRVTSALGVELGGVALVPAKTIPKTTSGKLKRVASCDAYLARDLPALKHWTALPEAEAVT